MKAVQASIVSKGGYDWQNFRSVRTPTNATKCAAFLRSACQNGSQVQSSAMQYWISYEFNQPRDTGTTLTLSARKKSIENYRLQSCPDKLRTTVDGVLMRSSLDYRLVGDAVDKF